MITQIPVKQPWRIWVDMVAALCPTSHRLQCPISNQQPSDCLLNHLFRCRSKKISKLRVTGLCARNSPETGEFPTQMASNVENVSIWWRHHVHAISCKYWGLVCQKQVSRACMINYILSIYGMLLLIHALDTCLWHSSPHLTSWTYSWTYYYYCSVQRHTM